MSDPKAPFGSTEIEILRYIGDHHPISVGEMAEHVAGTTGQARTTVLTIMERLRRKGHLTRKKIGGVYRYSPKVAKQVLLQDFGAELRGHDARRFGVSIRGISFRERTHLHGRPGHAQASGT